MNTEIAYIKEKEQRDDPKVVFPDCPQIIKYAFSIGDKDFYQFEDFNETPCERAFVALDYYAEERMKCDREYLKAHCAAVEEAINKNKMTDVMKLHFNLQERLTWITDIDVAYKLCSVVFFDGTENPSRYEGLHCQENAKLFRECKMDQFFFLTPLRELMPHISSLGTDLQSYCEAMGELKKMHLSTIMERLSSSDTKTEMLAYLRTQLAEVSIPASSESGASTSTT